MKKHFKFKPSLGLDFLFLISCLVLTKKVKSAKEGTDFFLNGDSKTRAHFGPALEQQGVSFLNLFHCVKTHLCFCHWSLVLAKWGGFSSLVLGTLWNTFLSKKLWVILLVFLHLITVLWQYYKLTHYWWIKCLTTWTESCTHLSAWMTLKVTLIQDQPTGPWFTTLTIKQPSDLRLDGCCVWGLRLFVVTNMLLLVTEHNWLYGSTELMGYGT